MKRCANCSKELRSPKKSNQTLCPKCSKHLSSHFKVSEPYDPPNQIEPNLWLGSYQSACNKSNLICLKIKNILIVGNRMKQKFPESFNYLQIPIDDDERENIFSLFPKLIKFIEASLAKNEGILVHCLGGVSRSATIVIAYMIKTKKWKMRRALKYVKEKRSCINPNKGFLDQLDDYADYIKKT